MLKDDPNYSRIRVRARGMGGVASYWLGPDHLLVVEIAGSQERYRRFYYSDVETMVIRPNYWGRVGNIFLAILAALLGFGAVSVGDIVGKWFTGILGGLMLLVLLLNTWRGRTCSCHLRTAVQSDELPGLNRVRTAGRVATELRERIVAAQGALSAADLAAPPPVLGGTAQTSAAPARSSTPRLHNADYTGRFHAILCWLLLVVAVFAVIDLVWQDERMDAAALLFVVVSLVINILAVVRQNGSLMPRDLRRLGLGLLIYQGVFMVIGIAYGIYMAEKHPERVGKTESPWDNPVSLAMDLTSIIVGFLGGIAGLMMLARFRRDRLTPPPLVAPVTAQPTSSLLAELPPLPPAQASAPEELPPPETPPPATPAAQP